MSDHRRKASRHRVDRRRHRSVVARGGRLGVLVAALFVTGVVGVMAIRPDGAPDSQAVADEVDAPSSSWLRDGLDTLHKTVHGAKDTTTDKQSAKPPNSTAQVDVPPDSGRGRRVVFDMSGQRVWMMRGDDKVRDTYLVSGSRSDNLKPGHYRVFSRSRNAVGFDGHSTMKFFVRFAHGKNAMIGFHDIPVNRKGKFVQSVDELGTPQSAGCIRQERADAKRMWRFASNDTPVVVVR